MGSFIDMMANHRWTEADILNRTEAMIASEFTPQEVEVINRIVTAAAAGIYQLTDEEHAKVQYYNLVCLQAREVGEAARADMVLLAKTLDYEAAKAVVDGADAATLELAAKRKPAPEPVAEPAPEPVTEPEPAADPAPEPAPEEPVA